MLQLLLLLLFSLVVCKSYANESAAVQKIVVDKMDRYGRKKYLVDVLAVLFESVNSVSRII
jgi:hypothetical protein